MRLRGNTVQREQRAKKGKSQRGKKPQHGGARQQRRGALCSGKAELYVYVKKRMDSGRMNKSCFIFHSKTKESKILVRQFPVVASRGYREPRMVQLLSNLRKGVNGLGNNLQTVFLTPCGTFSNSCF